MESEYEDHDTGSTSGDGSRSSRERDEIGEVRKMSSVDTNRVRMWRLAVAMCLLVTGVAITTTTYRFLKNEQNSNFNMAVRR